MRNSFSALFLDHPRDAGETYIEHAGVASRFGWRLLKAAACAYCHALIPALHRTTASDTVRTMAAELNGRAITAREARMHRAGAYDPGL